MPCEAPIGTPAASPVIDSQEPCWQSSRAFMSLGLALTATRPRVSRPSPCNEEALLYSVDSFEHTPSTQWSTARMPVDSHNHMGVCRVTSGSRITACGMQAGWRNISFTLVASLVTPAMPENSPADSVVGIETCRTTGGLISAAPLI